MSRAAALYRFSDLILSINEPLPELNPADPTSVPEVAITSEPAGVLDIRPTFAAWTTPNGGEWLTFADIPDGFLLTFAGYAQFRVSADAARVAMRAAPRTGADTARHLLMNQVLPLVLSRRGRLVLHASAVSWQNHAAAFIGRSGAGKSTMAAACAAAGALIVSDDCLVLRRDRAHHWSAVPCNAGVRLWPETLDMLGWPHTTGTDLVHFSDKRRVGEAHSPMQFETDARPLTRIFQLSRPDEEKGAQPLRGQAAVMALASELFRLDVRDHRESRAQFDAISALAGEVPVESLTRQPPSLAASAVLCKM